MPVFPGLLDIVDGDVIAKVVSAITIDRVFNVLDLIIGGLGLMLAFQQIER